MLDNEPKSFYVLGGDLALSDACVVVITWEVVKFEDVGGDGGGCILFSQAFVGSSCFQAFVFRLPFHHFPPLPLVSRALCAVALSPVAFVSKLDSSRSFFSWAPSVFVLRVVILLSRYVP